MTLQARPLKISPQVLTEEYQNCVDQVPPLIKTGLTFCFCLSPRCHAVLLHHANLHFVYICFSMGSRKRDHMWAQSVEPWRRAPTAA